MELSRLTRRTEWSWVIEPTGPMRVPVVIFGSEALVSKMDQKAWEQASNVAALPGIQQSVLVMPDAHSGYGFPVGGVAAFDADQDGVVSVGGVGFDISCEVRTLLTGLNVATIQSAQQRLADALTRDIPAGLGGPVRSVWRTMKLMRCSLAERNGLDQGYGTLEDLDRIEERGCVQEAAPKHVSSEAKRRQRDQMGTLGSGNHYLEVQKIAEIFDENIAAVFGLHEDEVIVTIHCGSRGLGHQIGTDYLREMNAEADRLGSAFADRELASASIHSELGERYLGAMRAGIKTALWPTGSSLAIWHGRSSDGYSLEPNSSCSMTSRTTPARWSSTRSAVDSWTFTFTERVRHPPSALPIPICLLSFSTWANRY
jgi:tRNA-splicing ligase RtcB (3'-phosphate/5'-hydroxy nucleic acid ligase)